MSPRLKVVVTGGGTGGHIFPALAIAEELIRRGFSVVYIGSHQGLEAKWVPPTGIPFLSVRSGAVKNQSLLKIAKTLIELASGFVSSIRHFVREKPAAVVGVGGYVSVPVVLAGFVLRKKIFLQEQNASVGLANRLLGRLAHQIFLGFESARKSFPASRCIHSGNPLRSDFYVKATPPLSTHPLSILILGGSQGAKSINSVVLETLQELFSYYPNTVVVHQTGEPDFTRVRDTVSKHRDRKITAAPFISDMWSAYAAASLVIARAGAITVTELIHMKRPALFIPYPRQGQNDQTDNAYMLERAGCARVVEQGENFKKRFWTTLQTLLDPVLLKKMHDQYDKISHPNALTCIGDEMTSHLK